MTNIYEQFDKAFLRVSAYTLLRVGDPIGRAAFKRPADGAGRLWCYLQVWGYPMVRDAVAKDFGLSWIRQLEAEGFTVAIVID